MLHGWMGSFVEVDLTKRQVNIEPSDPNLLQTYLGGRGIGARVLFDRVKPDIKPLDPDNLLIFCTGPLTATTAPTSARFSLTTAG